MNADSVARDLKAVRPEARFIAASILTGLGILDDSSQLIWLRHTVPPADGYDWKEMLAGIWSYQRDSK